MEYTKRVEESLKELVKNGFYRGRFTGKKVGKVGDKSRSVENEQNTSACSIEDVDSDGRYRVVKSSVRWITLDENNCVWSIRRIKEYLFTEDAQNPYCVAGEILLRKADDERAPWVGMKIGLTELGFVPREIYVDGRRYNIEHLILDESGISGFDSVESIYQRVTEVLEKTCRKHGIGLTKKGLLYIIMDTKKYIRDHIVQKIQDKDVSVGKERTVTDEVEEVVYFLERKASDFGA